MIIIILMTVHIEIDTKLSMILVAQYLTIIRRIT